MQKVVTKAAGGRVRRGRRSPAAISSSLLLIPLSCSPRASSIYRSIYMRVDIWIVASAPARVDERE